VSLALFSRRVSASKEPHNPATGLKCLRITRKDRPPVDPFPIAEAEVLIAAIHQDWGEAQGNYDEFRFFTGLRPSEQIALQVADCDLNRGEIRVSKARVLRRDKDRTKTGVDRVVELCPRALAVLTRHFALRAQLKRDGKIDHEDLFFQADGAPMRDPEYPRRRWRDTLINTVKGRYRGPYHARHSSVTWRLMAGKNLLWVAKQHGHSVEIMLRMYADWIDGATEADIEAIRRALQTAPSVARQCDGKGARLKDSSAGRDLRHTVAIPSNTPQFPKAVTRLSLGIRVGGLSIGNHSKSNGGEGGITLRASPLRVLAPAKTNAL
jgi:integrase